MKAHVLCLQSLLLGALILPLAGCSHSTSGSENKSSALLIPEFSTEDDFLQRFVDRLPGKTKLAPDFVYERLRAREEGSEIAGLYAAFRQERSSASEAKLIKAMEMEFIHSATTSSLDLLNPELSEHFREFPWQEEDYPGGTVGPNEQLADILTDVLDIISPERRANRSRTAVLLRSEVNDDIWRYLLGQWTPVPGEGDWKLNRHAVGSYLTMRDAAAADGVTLKILSGHRDPEKAAANAARVGNEFAVASFSSHSLGLAIDFVLPRADSEEPFRLSTRPMSHVVAMRESPVHKWLHLYGHQHGWYPFQHEPWHWEYNPEGFRETFWADYPAGAPVRE